jgi:hypothetical protein
MSSRLPNPPFEPENNARTLYAMAIPNEKPGARFNAGIAFGSLGPPASVLHFLLTEPGSTQNP